MEGPDHRFPGLPKVIKQQPHMEIVAMKVMQMDQIRVIGLRPEEKILGGSPGSKSRPV